MNVRNACKIFMILPVILLPNTQERCLLECVECVACVFVLHDFHTQNCMKLWDMGAHQQYMNKKCYENTVTIKKPTL